MIILPRSFLLKISGWIWVLSFWEAECTDGYSPSVAELSCTASVLTPATFTCNPNACKLPRVQNQALSTSVIPCPPDKNRDKLKWYDRIDIIILDLVDLILKFVGSLQKCKFNSIVRRWGTAVKESVATPSLLALHARHNVHLALSSRCLETFPRDTGLICSC